MSIVAELHGKTPFAFSEDLLTSNVFTAFRYLPADRGIIGFLRTVDGMAEKIEAPDPSSACTMHFWPRGPLREPDVLLELNIRGRLYHVVVEAKYRSGPSDYEDKERDGDASEEAETARLFGNQLAAEFQDLAGGTYWKRVKRWSRQPLQLKSAPVDRFLLYLTAHLNEPEAERRNFERCLPNVAGRLYWTSWYQVYDYVSCALDEWGQEPYCFIVRDLLALLKQKGFCPFDGLSEIPAIEPGALPRYRWLGEKATGA